MGKCSKCGKKILYNKYVMYQGRVLCVPCNTAMKKEIALLKEKVKADKAMKKLLRPSRKAKKAMEDEGITVNDDDNDEKEKATDPSD